VSSLTSLFHREESSPLFGLDISSSSVKLVELTQGKSGDYILEHCGLELLEPGWIEGGNIENFDAVVAAVQRVVRTSGTKARRVALALPPPAVITKKIMLAADLSEAEMEVQVEAEASQYIPFPLEEVSLDFCVLGPASGSGKDVEVLLAASRKEKVQDRQAVAEEAGLKPAIMDVDIFAAQLAASRVIDSMQLGKNGIVALFEIGGSTTTLQVLRGGESVYERDLSFGGQQLTQAMARQYGFTQQEAEAKKRTHEVPEDFETTLLPEFVGNAASEISRAMQLFLSSTVYGKVDRILLAGGVANVAGLDAQVAKQAGCQAMVINPFEGMQIGRGVRQQRLVHEAPSYLTACGLAMRRFQQ
jgi:type IV pilus assembly protein PilM